MVKIHFFQKVLKNDLDSELLYFFHFLTLMVKTQMWKIPIFLTFPFSDINSFFLVTRFPIIIHYPYHFHDYFYQEEEIDPGPDASYSDKDIFACELSDQNQLGPRVPFEIQ